MDTRALQSTFLEETYSATSPQRATAPLRHPSAKSSENSGLQHDSDNPESALSAAADQHSAQGRTLRAPKASASRETPRALLGGAVVVASLSILLLMLFLLYKSSTPTKKVERLCTCREATEARAELLEFKVNQTRKDAELVLTWTAPLSSVDRVVEAQRNKIWEQQALIRKLRDTARAKDMGWTTQEAANKTYSVFLVEEDKPSLWKQRKFKKHANFGFVSFSSYRLSPSVIVVVGLGHFLSRGNRRLQRCFWEGENGRRVEGKLGLEPMEEHHRFLYELLLLNCTLPWPDQVPQSLPSGKERMYSSSKGGHLEVQLDQEIFHPFKEIDGYKIHAEDSDGPFQFETLYCGPPMFGRFSIPSLLQWIDYHRYHAGMDHFIFYDSGAVSAKMLRLLKPLIVDAVVTVTDFREALQYDIWAENQALAMHDCLFRSRNIARWIFFHDLDEYLHFPKEPLPSLLRKYADKPYLTHGCIRFDPDSCEERDVWNPQHDKFAVEMMVHRWKQPYCTSGEYKPNMCLNYHGHRKMVQNPRKVLRTYVHISEIPDQGGVDLDIEDMRHAHFRSLFNPKRPCSKEPQKGDHMEKDTSIAEIASKARECAKQAFSSDKCKPT